MFLIVYDLFLKKETFFSWNRIYLLITPILSFVLPLFKIEAFRNAVPEQYLIQLPAVMVGKNTPQEAIALDPVTISQMDTSILSLSTILQTIWIFGAFIALIIFTAKLYRFYTLKQSGTQAKLDNYHLIYLPNSTAAFSFFNTVFIGNNLSKSEQENILIHEKVHATHKHTIDLLFFEFLRIICWFNPLVYVFQKKITELQEFIADREVAKQQSNKQYYQSLLSQVFQTSSISFTNTFFNQSLIKKRIVMLQKSKSKKIFQLKYLLLIPVVCGMLFYTSCSQETGVAHENASLTQKIADLQTEIENKDMSQEERQAFIKMVQKTLNLNEESSKIIIHENGVVAAIKTEETDGKNVDVPFAAIDKVPTFPGCEEMGNEEAKKCMSKNIMQLVVDNFNSKVGDNTGLTGKQRIFVQFKIDKNGEVTNVKARAPHPDLEAEALRVVNKIPQMQPGEHRGKKVGVLYSLPILFTLD